MKGRIAVSKWCTAKFGGKGGTGQVGHGGSHSAPPRFDDRMKAMLGSVATFILLLLVVTISTAENLLFGRSQLSVLDLAIFGFGALAIVDWLGVWGSSDRVRTLLALLGRATRTGTVVVVRDLDSRETRPGTLRRVLGGLWVPVTLQFVLVGWLIYASGGIANSPYSSVPVVMMLIGQSVYETPSIELGDDIKVRDLLMFVCRVARAYCYPLLMFVVLFGVLVLLQEHHPLVTRSAPSVEIVFTTLVNLFFGMCVVLVTRRVDRTFVENAS
jgi:hypothetical protein